MEGPQTRALADHLGDLLAGRAVERIIVPEDRWQANVVLLNCVGQVVQRVRSHGKWLFFDFSHGMTWLCQLITRAKWTLLTPDQADQLVFTGGENHHRPRRKQREPLITLHLRQKTGDNLVAVL